jgi:hypothetical protein
VTWFRVDDQFAGHPKVVRIPRKVRLQALGLWLAAGCRCAQYLTDGFVSEEDLAELGGTPALAQALVDARVRPGDPGLWLVVDGGWQFHDWHLYQPTRASVEAEREATRKRVQQFRDRRRRERENGGETDT